MFSYNKRKGILFADKPKGISSFDVIRILRRQLGVKKIGHAGTLDPLASGLMILGIGKGTKRLGEYLKLPKRYEVEILLGESRTTGDMEGEITESTKVLRLNKNKVKKILKEMEGELELFVPRYSAIKLGGERLYRKARRGEVFVAPKKVMKLHSLKLKKIRKEFDKYTLFVSMDVGSGAYVRSIAEEIGKRLGYPAVTKELRRTKIGKHRIWKARKIKAQKKRA
jgi:tRNA pseudouridine55 synthase